MDTWTVDNQNKRKMMIQHSYKLQKYAGVSSRYTCPACGGKHCFTRYVDENGELLHESVGRCDHESSCGYHYTPKEYFQDHPQTATEWKPDINYKPYQKPRPEPTLPLCTIQQLYVNHSLKLDYDSNLTLFLKTIIKQSALDAVLQDYKVGVTKNRDTIYFQIDTQNRCRTGKIMKYDRTTGHRIKDDATSNKITWVHSILKTQGKLPSEWTLSQCLFGEHLLPKYPDKIIALVESEKTAIICATLMSKYLWIATGGKSQLSETRLAVLKGRKVIAFPDVDAYGYWKEKLSFIIGLSVTVSDYLERTATQEERDAHIDIADRLMSQSQTTHPAEAKQTDSILQYFSEQYRAEIQMMIDELDLIPVKIQHIK